MNIYIETIGSVRYCNSSCPHTDGTICPSCPPKVRCILNNEYYVIGEICKFNEERNKTEMSNNMEESVNQFPLEVGESINIKPTLPEKKTLIVNLFGVPGSGKSTGSAYIFAMLKMAGVNAELATEFAKDKVWEESVEVFKNQAYIFGKQSFKLTRVRGKVDVVITDSPILLSCFYNNQPELGENFTKMCLDVYNSFDNYDVLLTRVKPYNPAGRFQTEEESNALAKPMRDMLQKFNIPYIEYPGNQAGYDMIVKDILSILNNPTQN